MVPGVGVEPAYHIVVKDFESFAAAGGLPIRAVLLRLSHLFGYIIFDICTLLC